MNYTRTQAEFQEEEANNFVERENSLFFFKNVKITYKIPKEQLFGGFDLICINIPMHKDLPLNRYMIHIVPIV